MDGSEHHGTLTRREAALLGWVAEGRSNREIAREMHLSSHTIKHLIERLIQKLGARNRIELAAWAGCHGHYRPLSPAPGTIPEQRSVDRCAP